MAYSWAWPMDALHRVVGGPAFHSGAKRQGAWRPEDRPRLIVVNIGTEAGMSSRNPEPFWTSRAVQLERLDLDLDCGGLQCQAALRQGSDRLAVASRW